MTTFESRTTRVDTTPDELFGFLNAIDTITDWYDEWDDVTHDGRTQTLEADSSFNLTSRQPHRSATCRLVEASAPNTLSWNEYSGHGSTILVSSR